MVRVLHIVSVLHRGGVETMLMNFYRNLDRNQVQFDFIVHGDTVGVYEPLVKELGGRVFHVRTKSESFFGNLRDITRIVRENGYKIVEVHQDAMSAFALKAAKKGGAEVRIAHAHATGMPPSLLGRLLYPYALKRTTKFANVKLSCSEKSAEYLFNGDISGTKYVFNGIDTEKFSFSPAAREALRREQELDGFVVIQVGNFMYPKNQQFTLQVFRSLLEQRSDARLVFCGSGADMEAVRAEAVAKGLNEKILFAGNVDNVEQWMCAADALVMPSFYEGFPVSLIEAQCAGLRCVASDTITRETQITDRMAYLPLSVDIAQWVQALLEDNAREREQYARQVREAGFDVKCVARDLQEMYEQLGGQNG